MAPTQHQRKRERGNDEGAAASAAPAAKKAPSAVTLPWMRVPISIQPGGGQPIDQVPGMDARLQAALRQGSSSTSNGSTPAVKELFPVQAVVWTEMGGGLRTEHDLCIAAPTGSGKTLAYALPVINALAQQTGDLPGGSSSSSAASRSRRSLRALVVLPTGDLAEQVASVMRPLCAAVGLNLQLAAARVSVGAEADAIMQGAGLQGPGTATSHHHHHRNQHQAAVLTASMQLLTSQWATTPGQHRASRAHQGPAGGGGGGDEGGGGATDVLVATPGRLMTHLASTPGFTLRHLRFLVVDETDRLLRQSYQEWLPHVLAELHGPEHDAQAWRAAHSALLASSGAAAAALSTPQAAGTSAPHLPRCVKLIASATLTRDPAKVQRLRLHCPRFVAVTSASPTAAGGEAQAGPHRYQLPKSLKEYKVLCSAARKPITLLALLKQLEGHGQCVVFASSLDTTHRLYLLLRTVLDGSAGADAGATSGKKQHPTVVECSGHKAAAVQRAEALRLFKSGAARVLVASDVVTRGMDFEGNVSVVVNYDAPVYAKTYVHRAGRTARAGREGSVYTLLRDEDVRHFKAMLRKADNSYVADYKLPAGGADAMAGGLSVALQEVAALLAAEQEDDRERAKQPQR